MIPLFDANAHPVLSGTVFNKPSNFRLLLERLNVAGFAGACAVGLPGCGEYQHEAFFSECERYKELFPVAAWGDVAVNDIEAELSSLKALGYGAVKVHPRLSGLSVRDPRFLAVLRAAESVDIAIFLCAYQFSAEPGRHPVDPLPWLMEAIESTPRLRLVLLHGGTVEALRYAEAVRASRNVLLDLSFTLNRFKGSSVDLDIAYLFMNFDRRICIGSDFPEYDPLDVRERFELFAASISDEKRANIGWRNITELLRIQIAASR